MKTDLDHLPRKIQWEIEQVKDIILEEFEKSSHNKNPKWKLNQRIDWIILFGSHARHDWVNEHRAQGYKSDYDILVIVSNEEIADMILLWDDIEDKIISDKRIKREVTLVIETLSHVYDELTKGTYFFSDIKKQGVALHQKPTKALKSKKHLTAQESYDMAQEY
jgi:predicted nucleotidyltransferase